MVRVGYLFLFCFFLLFSACTHTSKKLVIKQTQAHIDAGKSLMAERSYRQALREFLSAAKLDSNNPELNYFLALTYFVGFGRSKEAKNHLEVVFRGQRKSPEAENLMGAILIEEGEHERAVIYLKKARDNVLYDTPFFAEQNLGKAFLAMSKFDEAIESLKRALKQNQELCGAYLPLAKSYEGKGFSKKALRPLQRFLHVCDREKLKNFIPKPMVGIILHELGMMHLAQGDEKRAQEAFFQCKDRFLELEIGRACNAKL